MRPDNVPACPINVKQLHDEAGCVRVRRESGVHVLLGRGAALRVGDGRSDRPRCQIPG